MPVLRLYKASLRSTGLSLHSARTLHFLHKFALLIYEKFAYRERYFTSAINRAKFRSLETSDQQFRLLDRRPEVNPVFIFLIKLLTLPNIKAFRKYAING